MVTVVLLDTLDKMVSLDRMVYLVIVDTLEQVDIRVDQGILADLDIQGPMGQLVLQDTLAIVEYQDTLVRMDRQEHRVTVAILVNQVIVE